MKRLVIASVILVVIFAAALINTRFLGTYTKEISGLLQNAETSASGFDWNAAGKDTDKAMELWEKKRAYFYVTLFHGETDAVYQDFCEVKKLIEYQQYGEYSAANARLIARLKLLWDMERLTLENVF